MNTFDTTICAISTPPGAGGIATARISGRDTLAIVARIWKGRSLADVDSHTAHLGTIVDPDSGEALDTAVATVFRAPRSFTGEETVELTVHGSKWIQRELINLLIRQGATLAQPGEFTQRAVRNGQLDLAQAEAVGDMIAASSRAAQRIALSHMRGHYSAQLDELRNRLLELSALVELELDFSEEDVEFADRQKLLELANEIHARVTSLAASFATGRAIKDGIPVAIVGATNAGKSTIMNRLLGEEKAIVSDIHGTTRDTIEDTIEINGTLYRFIDTAGLRQTADPIESIGIERARQSAAKANIVMWIIDPADCSRLNDTWAEIKSIIAPDTHLIAVINKADKGLTAPELPKRVNATISISALTDNNLNPLINLLDQSAGNSDLAPELTVTNARHYEALTHAAESISRAIDGLQNQLPGDLLAQDLRETATHLAAITSPITSPDLLSLIFSTFCIGK